MEQTPLKAKTTTQYILEILAKFATKWGWKLDPTLFDVGYVILRRGDQELNISQLVSQDDHIIANIRVIEDKADAQTATTISIPTIFPVGGASTIGITSGTGLGSINTTSQWVYTQTTTGHTTQITNGSSISTSTAVPYATYSGWFTRYIATFNCYIGDPKLLRKFRAFAKVITPTPPEPEPIKYTYGSDFSGWSTSTITYK